MLKKRIIVCLDVKDGRTVKGTHFKALKDAGDAVELAAFYAEEGADELVFLDISASSEKRQTARAFARRVAREVNIPFTIGGGISSAADAGALLDAGADKIALNTAALANPDIIDSIAKNFGSQFISLSVDAKIKGSEYWVYSHGGQTKQRLLLPWLKEIEERGAGELLLTSIDADGTGEGFDIHLYQMLSKNYRLPVIASGGAGTKEHFKTVLEIPVIDAALAAGLFHFNKMRLPDLKDYLKQEKLIVR